MCTQKTGNHTEEMYRRYQESFQEYLVSNVLPAVQKLDSEPMVSPAPQSPSLALPAVLMDCLFLLTRRSDLGRSSRNW